MNMMTLRHSIIGLTFMALAVAPTAADATVYMGADSVRMTSISLSLTTDGTLGSLTSANITDWRIVATDPNPLNNVTYTPMNSVLAILGNALSATSSSLTFDFGSAGSNAIQFVENPPSADPSTLGFVRFYCLDTAYTCTGSGSNRLTESSAAVVFDQQDRAGFKFAARSGVDVLGTAAEITGAVPEPSSWAMMLTGFGLLGLVMRRRRALAGFARAIPSVA